MFRFTPVLALFLLFVTVASPAQMVSPDPSRGGASLSARNAGTLSPAQSADAPSPTEDWNTLSLAGSNLPLSATGAVLLGKYDAPTFTRELLRVQWRPSDPIDLYVIRPRGAAKTPVILYLYNYTSDTSRFQDDGWCQRATQDGFAAVGFVSALSGQRFHAPRPMKQWFVSQLQEALATSTHDVQMILNYLATRPDLDMTRLGMFGQASGGAVAILAAAVDPRIRALDVVDPWGDWPDWLEGSQQIPDTERPQYLTAAFMQNVAHLDPVGYLPELSHRQLRVQQLLDDPVTPALARDKVAAVVPRPGDLVRYQDMEALKKAWKVEGLSGWLRQQLTSPCPACSPRSPQALVGPSVSATASALKQ
jgi:hypothetical protein